MVGRCAHSYMIFASEHFIKPMAERHEKTGAMSMANFLSFTITMYQEERVLCEMFDSLATSSIQKPHSTLSFKGGYSQGPSCR